MEQSKDDTNNIENTLEAEENQHASEVTQGETDTAVDSENSTQTKTQQLLEKYNIGQLHHVWHDLKPRVMSSLIMLAVFLFAVINGGAVFSAMVIAVAMLMIREWDFLTTEKEAKWGWIGIAYITAACASIIWLRSISTPEYVYAGMGLVIYLVAIVIATDVSAYFVGKRFGKNKLAESISPGKTWEGLIGGVIGAGVAGFLCSSFTPFPAALTHSITLAMLMAFVAQAGDLFESKLKREADVKDSGELIKGHGGVLDRLDGMLTTAPFFALIFAIFG